MSGVILKKVRRMNVNKQLKKRTFTIVLPEFQNVHLIKDVGMIPFIMGKYFNYDAKIACYESKGLLYLNNDVKGLGIDLIEKNGTPLSDGEAYLRNKANEIDVLYVFGIYPWTMAWIEAYKSFNPNGKVYLKLDANIYWMNRMDFRPEILSVLAKCDLISVECRTLHTYLNRKLPVKIEYIPNGFHPASKHSHSLIKFSEKENTILTVGRLGIHQKANEILLQAFAKVSSYLSDWRLKLVGEMDESFKPYINKFFEDYPALKDKVEFTGPIDDRNKLWKEYQKAKIFCLTSRLEGFPLVYPEAAANGCYIVSSDIDPAYDITNNGELGTIFPVDDHESLAQVLVQLCKEKSKLEQACVDIQQYANRQFRWTQICKKLDILLRLS